MKNPYLYGYIPLFSIVLFSLTFGIFAVSESMAIFKGIGIYGGMREFLSDFELRVLLLVMFSLLFFMTFSALKLIGTTIHELGMLFFSKDKDGETMKVARGGNVIFFFGALVSAVGIQSFIVLIVIFVVTVLVYYIYVVYKLSTFMNFTGMLGLIVFEIIFWALFLTAIIFVFIRLYNSLVSSLPFI